MTQRTGPSFWGWISSKANQADLEDKKKLLKMEGLESNIRGYRYWFGFINVPRSQTLYMAPFAAISLTLLIIINNIFIYTKIEQSNSIRGSESEGEGLCSSNVSTLQEDSEPTKTEWHVFLQYTAKKGTSKSSLFLPPV